MSKKINIFTNGAISIDGEDTGLFVTQIKDGTLLYTGESKSLNRAYKVHKLPSQVYSLAFPNTTLSGNPGRAAFEKDLLDHVNSKDFVL